jgi:hypothetical protein
MCTDELERSWAHRLHIRELLPVERAFQSTIHPIEKRRQKIFHRSGHFR